jgi:membrane-bound inhibitor of C-type lysozyme
MLRAAILALALPQAALAQQFSTATYACDRGVQVPATYVNGPEQSLAIVNVDGRQITLVGEEAASGARYGWPSGGSGYVWWTKGDEATLYWKTPEVETAILTCKEAT